MADSVSDSVNVPSALKISVPDALTELMDTVALEHP
jgi:hypothetical protein